MKTDIHMELQMYDLEDIKIGDFFESEITDIREICYDEKCLECNLLRFEVKMHKESANHWRNLYESAMKSIINYVK